MRYHVAQPAPGTIPKDWISQGASRYVEAAQADLGFEVDPHALQRRTASEPLPPLEEDLAAPIAVRSASAPTPTRLDPTKRYITPAMLDWHDKYHIHKWIVVRGKVYNQTEYEAAYPPGTVSPKDKHDETLLGPFYVAEMAPEGVEVPVVLRYPDAFGDNMLHMAASRGTAKPARRPRSTAFVPRPSNGSTVRAASGSRHAI